jgi:hypothetical protein
MQQIGLGLPSLGLVSIPAGGTFSINFPASNSAFDLDFANDRYNGGVTILTGLRQNQSQSDPSFAINADGSLTRWAGSTTLLRRSNLGLWIEDAHTNIVLRNRDGSNAVWTKSNVTAVRDQVGADGVASAAFRITATSTNGTILQAITDASKARRLVAYVKRLVGTGTLEMTMDNGTTWTVVSSGLSSSVWTRCTIPDQTLANPTVGFRIATSADSFIIDLVDCSNNVTNETTPNAPTTVTVVSGRDRPSTLSASNQAIADYLRTQTTRCIYWEYAQRQNGALCATDGDFAVSSNSTGASIGAVTTANTPRMSANFAELITTAKVNKCMAWRTAGESGICLNGGTIARGSGGSPDGGHTHTDFGTNGAGNLSTLGRIVRMVFFNSVPSDLQIIAATTVV